MVFLLAWLDKMLIVHALSGLYVGVECISSVFMDDGNTKWGLRIGSLFSLWSMLRLLLFPNSSWRLTCALNEGVCFDLCTHDINLFLDEPSSGWHEEIIPRCRLIMLWFTTCPPRWLLFSGVVIISPSASPRFSQHFHFMDLKRSAKPLRNRLENILYKNGFIAELRR